MMRFICMLSVFVALCGLVAPAQAQTKKELHEQFKTRFKQLKDLKEKGQIGETFEGYVEVVDPKAAVEEKAAKLIADENADRRKLYQILADEINAENPNAKVKATVETIASRNAARNFERAGANEFLRVAKDYWIRAKDYPRFEKLYKLKTQGKVGETGAGMVEIVNPADQSDAEIKRLVDEENKARNEEYKALAEKEKVDVSVIVKRMVKRNFENAAIGQMVKEEGGAWKKK